MADSFPGQHEGEEIDFVFRQHPVVIRKQMIAGMGIFALSMVPLLVWPTETWLWWLVLGGFLLGLAIFGYRFISWFFSVYIITTERFIQVKQKGFFDRKVQDISHNRIQSVNYEIKGVQETLLRFGTVTVQTFVGDIVLPCIHKPEEVQQHLNKIIRDVAPVDPQDIEEGGDHE